ncbi:MAG: hypothetical protein ACOX4P_06275 [Anaerovoracaceae bacterium]|jgi:hypothetical protein
MKRIKTVIGLLLIIGAILGLVYWELEGREMVLTEQFLVARETILPGTVVTPDHFTQAKILEENKIEGALKPHKINEIVGKAAVQRIVKNDQIVTEYFSEDSFSLKNGESVFVIKPEWISMRSSSLRRGDWIDIYTDRENSLIGTYRVAYVKDSNEVEVRDSGEGSGQYVLGRSDGTSIINHIEIITDLSGYQKILREIETNGSGLILVQKVEGIS